MTRGQETQLRIVTGMFSRMDDGVIKFEPDPLGKWQIIEHRPTSPLVKYFTPKTELGIDVYGQIKNPQ